MLRAFIDATLRKTRLIQWRRPWRERRLHSTGSGVFDDMRLKFLPPLLTRNAALSLVTAIVLSGMACGPSAKLTLRAENQEYYCSSRQLYAALQAELIREFGSVEEREKWLIAPALNWSVEEQTDDQDDATTEQPASLWSGLFMAPRDRLLDSRPRNPRPIDRRSRTRQEPTPTGYRRKPSGGRYVVMLFATVKGLRTAHTFEIQSRILRMAADGSSTIEISQHGNTAKERVSSRLSKQLSHCRL